MKAGGYDFQCLGPTGPQTRESAFYFLQEKLGQSDTADYNGFHLKRKQSSPYGTVSDVIIARQQKPRNGAQPVVFAAVRTTQYRGVVGYNFSVSRSANPKLSNDDDWSQIDLHPGACEQGVKTLVADSNPRFRQMDPIELGAYAYLFGTGLQTLDYDPAVDYGELQTSVPKLCERILDPGRRRFADGAGLFTRTESHSEEETKVIALNELLTTLKTLEGSAAVLPAERENATWMLSFLAYRTVGGLDPEKAEWLATNDVRNKRIVTSVLASLKK